MSPAARKIEVGANIAIILVAIILGFVLVKKFVFTDDPAPNSPKQPQVGAKVFIPGTDFSSKDKNLILALKKGCKYCTESAGFYQKLVTAANEKNVRLMAVFPHSVEEGQTYLKELNVPVTENKEADFTALNVGGTPTIILANRSGDVVRAWMGKLNPEQETEVLNSIQ
jgi:thioredoxin-related protein